MLSTKLGQAFYYLKKKIITVLGDVKVYKTPCFVMYDPGSYLLKGKDFDQVSQVIRKYDVMLRRFDAYLDNGFIPGWWNHAGIYMGRAKDKNGTVIHAVAEGVLQETLFDFMRADHICILRPKFEYDPIKVDAQVMKAMKKEYDFDFDFANGDRLSCTETINFVFDGCQHGISRDRKFLGRTGTAPDDILAANFEQVLSIKHV